MNGFILRRKPQKVKCEVVISGNGITKYENANGEKLAKVEINGVEYTGAGTATVEYGDAITLYAMSKTTKNPAKITLDGVEVASAEQGTWATYALRVKKSVTVKLSVHLYMYSPIGIVGDVEIETGE